MISLVLYGRNDSYGYNLHKRAALSLNCMAEMLTDPDDEILFVDYNTPDDFPTFPEAIQDTLTDRARRCLRILRARPRVHARFRDRTHLMALEPVARNIAVRRSNPANRWILSTNTDMIFVPRNGKSLTEIVRDLPKGYYGIPRFELPESLWETLDRRDAAGVIETVGSWGWQFHLNETVYGAREIKFDAPGDFQLIERSQLFDIHGFEEDMLLGWHVDSNLCKRLFLMHSDVGDLSQELFGYHCDHTRQVTPMHKRRAKENSLKQFVESIEDPRALHQANSWGCPDDEIEEIRLADSPGHLYLRCLSVAIKKPMERVSEWVYSTGTYDKVHYDAEHVLPYLVDVLVSAPRSWTIGWFGEHASMFRLFHAMWREIGFRGSIMVPSDSMAGLGAQGSPGVISADLKQICEKADAFVFDFVTADGTPLGDGLDGRDDALIRRLLRAFYSVVAAETERIGDPELPPRRVIAINAIHNRFETLLRGHVEFARSPASTRLRHGFVVEPLSEAVAESWLPLMNVRPNAIHVADGIRASQLKRGYVLSGPGVSLTPGRYAVHIDVLSRWPGVPFGWMKLGLAYLFGRAIARATRPAETTIVGPFIQKPKSKGKRKWRKYAAFTVEIQSRGEILQRSRWSLFQFLRSQEFEVEFDVAVEDVISPQPLAISVLVWTSGMVEFVIKSVELVQVMPAEGGGTVAK
ncbi:MAG: hypothetical protein ABW003_29605 [Microvirga sp.]